MTPIAHQCFKIRANPFLNCDHGVGECISDHLPVNLLSAPTASASAEAVLGLSFFERAVKRPISIPASIQAKTVDYFPLILVGFVKKRGKCHTCAQQYLIMASLGVSTA